jgi:hypothetical protein
MIGDVRFARSMWRRARTGTSQPKKGCGYEGVLIVPPPADKELSWDSLPVDQPAPARLPFSQTCFEDQRAPRLV